MKKQKQTKYEIADSEFREIIKIIKGHKITFNALALAGKKAGKNEFKLDYSDLNCTISLTMNEIRLLHNLLLDIPVAPNSLEYECAKSMIKKMSDEYERQLKNKKNT